MGDYNLEIRVTYQHIVGYHVEYCACGLCQVLVGCQRNGRDEFAVRRRRLVRMGDDDCFPAVQIIHEGIQFRVTKILSVAVGGEFHSVRSQNFKSITRLFQSLVHIRKGERSTEKEPSGVEGLQSSGFFVESAADPGGFFSVAEIRLRGRHGKD